MKLSLLITCILIIGCTSSKTIVEATPKSIALDKLVANKKFKIESDWASPRASNSLNALSNSGLLGVGNSSGSINLIGNANFLKIEGDTITADLPYYGERQMGGGYTSETGVKFKGVPKKYEAIKDDKLQRNIISFQINQASESYNITITLFPNWTSSIVVNSSQRTPISYQGNVLEITEKK